MKQCEKVIQDKLLKDGVITKRLIKSIILKAKKEVFKDIEIFLGGIKDYAFYHDEEYNAIKKKHLGK